MERRRVIEWLALPSSAVAALLVGAVMLAARGTNPVTGYRALVTGAFGGSYALGATAVKAVPLASAGPERSSSVRGRRSLYPREPR